VSCFDGQRNATQPIVASSRTLLASASFELLLRLPLGIHDSISLEAVQNAIERTGGNGLIPAFVNKFLHR
jgi:hypothetical protein